MTVARVIRAVPIFLLLIGGTRSTEEVSGPMDTVDAVLELHGLSGKTPEERRFAARAKTVDENALRQLFWDFDAYDLFLANLYAGFVAGALARHQHTLVMTKRGDRLLVHTGNLDVVMYRRNDRWWIVLDQTIPDAIRRQAEAQREHFLKRVVVLD